MGFFDALRLTAAITAPDTEPDITAELGPRVQSLNGAYQFNDLVASMTRTMAMQIPAARRCQSLITGIISGFGLDLYDTETNRELTDTLPWLKQIDERMPNPVVIAATVDSLIWYGVAYWEITDTYPSGMPRRFAFVNRDRVTVNYNRAQTLVDSYTVDGQRRPMNGLGSLVTFSGLREGVLASGSLALRRAYQLQRASLNYALSPTPSVALKNNGAELPESSIIALLTGWMRARQERSVAYVSSQFEIQQMSYSPVEMALNEQIDNADGQIAELFNVDPYWVNAQKSSMTYSNVRDTNRQLYQATLRDYVNVIESRLSMPDIIPGGTERFEIRMDLDDFLRADPMERVTVAEKLFQNGVITVDEWRGMEDFAPRGSEQEEVSDV